LRGYFLIGDGFVTHEIGPALCRLLEFVPQRADFIEVQLRDLIQLRQALDEFLIGEVLAAPAIFLGDEALLPVAGESGLPFLPFALQTFLVEPLHFGDLVLALLQAHPEGLESIERLLVLIEEQGVFLGLFDQPGQFCLNLGGLIQILAHALFALEIGHAQFLDLGVVGFGDLDGFLDAGGQFAETVFEAQQLRVELVNGLAQGG